MINNVVSVCFNSETTVRVDNHSVNLVEELPFTVGYWNTDINFFACPFSFIVSLESVVRSYALAESIINYFST